MQIQEKNRIYLGKVVQVDRNKKTYRVILLTVLPDGNFIGKTLDKEGTQLLLKVPYTSVINSKVI